MSLPPNGPGVGLHMRDGCGIGRGSRGSREGGGGGRCPRLLLVPQRTCLMVNYSLINGHSMCGCGCGGEGDLCG